MAYLVSKWRENCVLSAHSSFGAFGLTPGPLGGSFQQALTQFQASLKTTRSQTPYLWMLIVPLQSAHQPGMECQIQLFHWPFPSHGNSDVVLVVEEDRFHVHRCILGMLSEVFSTMFTGNTVKTPRCKPFLSKQGYNTRLASKWSG